MTYRNDFATAAQKSYLRSLAATRVRPTGDSTVAIVLSDLAEGMSITKSAASRTITALLAQPTR